MSRPLGATYVSTGRGSFGLSLIACIAFWAIARWLQIKWVGLGFGYDVGLYQTYGRSWGSGQIPYVDFHPEYPPGAIAVFVAAWLSGEAGAVNPVSAGEKLFSQLACVTCHLANGTGRAPSLNGVYGAKVLLADGSTVVADEAYIRESILQPKAKIVAGYQPVMPTFQGLVTEEQILNLTAYIKSLQSQPVPAKGAGIAPSTAGKK